MKFKRVSYVSALFALDVLCLSPVSIENMKITLKYPLFSKQVYTFNTFAKIIKRTNTFLRRKLSKLYDT